MGWATSSRFYLPHSARVLLFYLVELTLNIRTLRVDDGCDLRQRVPAEPLRSSCEPPTLVVRKTKSATAQLFAQNTILLAQIVNCLLLLLIHSVGDRDQHEPERIENTHNPTVSRVISAMTSNVHCFQRVRVSGQNAVVSGGEPGICSCWSRRHRCTRSFDDRQEKNNMIRTQTPSCLPTKLAE